MSRRGRRHSDALAEVDREHEYQPAEAVALVRSLSKAKFDESIEVHVRTGLNVRHADEQLRGTIALPNGVGKDVKIAKGSGEPNREKVGTITQRQLREIAERKLPDLNAHDVEQAAKIIAGTARSMGVEVAP